MLLPLLSAILHYASLPPLSLWPLAFISLVPLFFFVLRESRWWKLAIGISLYRLVAIALIGGYLPDPLHLLDELVVFSPFIFFVIIFKRLNLKNLPLLALVGASFCAAEYVSAWHASLPTFVAMAGLPLAGTFFLPLSQLSGLVGLSLFAVAVNVAVAHILISFLEYKKNVSEESRRLRRRAMLWGFLFIVILVGFGAFLSSRIEKERKSLLQNNPPKSELSAVIVSTGGKFEDGTKYFDETRSDISLPKLASYINATLGLIGEKLNAAGPPDIVVLPENMFDFFLFNDANAEMEKKFNIVTGGVIFSQFQLFAKKHHVAVLSSLHTIDTSGNKRQTAFLIGSDGHFVGISQKTHLTIASEYWPFGSRIPFYWRYALPLLPPTLRQEAFIGLSPTGQYSPASEPFAPIVLNNISIGPLICSDEHYPDGYQSFAQQGTDMFVTLSNNTWLSFAAGQYREEVNLIRRAYAFEHGMPIVVSGKKDSAGVVYPDGRFDGVIPQKTDSIVMVATKIYFNPATLQK